jgi:Flp pilus assembly CpaE family ATPase
VSPPTAGGVETGSTGGVRALNVAVVSRDGTTRLEAARAFDSAPPHWTVGLHREPPPDADVVVACPDVDIEADAVFDPDVPGRVLDDVMRVAGRTRRALIVAVTSPSGGAGTTTLALHLAQASARSAPTCLLDCDLEWGVGYRLALAPDARTWAEAGESEDSLLRAALPLPGGFRVLASPGRTGTSDFGALLEGATSQFSRVVVDAARASTAQDVLAAADAVVLVIAPTAPSAHRARDVLDGLTGGKVAIVTNRTGPGGEMNSSEIERILGCKVALELPCERRLRDVEDDGRLLRSQWSRWERGIHRLWRALESS